jgi:hypothetical protein
MSLVLFDENLNKPNPNEPEKFHAKTAMLKSQSAQTFFYLSVFFAFFAKQSFVHFVKYLAKKHKCL